MLDYAERKRILLLSRDAAVQFILGTEVPGPPRLRKKPVSPSTRVVIHQQHRRVDNQGIKAGQEKSGLQTLKKRMRGVISPPHCQEFNFTQLTSATDK